ncbi:hypothetical protein LEMLEM_LOCUS24075, partial [Lemmus lemmus]
VCVPSDSRNTVKVKLSQQSSFPLREIEALGLLLIVTDFISDAGQSLSIQRAEKLPSFPKKD